MKIHIVKKGDTMYLIAKKYNIPLEDLIKANPEIADPDVIDVGMKVKIPAPSQPAYELIHQHTVQQGDTLWKLSKAWGIPLADMIKANPQLKNPNVLLTGEIVNIPKVPAGGAMDNVPVTGPAGKKPTGVKPEKGVVFEPAAEAPLPEPLPVLPEPAPVPLPEPLLEKPVKPAPVEPALVEPAPAKPDVKEPYPAVKKDDQDLFAQFPIPAVEAVSQMPEFPVLPVNVQMPAVGAEMAKDYTYPAETYDYHFDKDFSPPYPYTGMEGAIGKVFDPHDVSGFDGKQGFGDISNLGVQNVTGLAKTNIPGVTGYLPAYVPGLISPSAFGTAKPAGGCVTCGGTPASQTVPTMQAQTLPYQPTAVSPIANANANAGYPGMGMQPTAVSPAMDVYPNVGYPGMGMQPTAVSPAMDVYPNVGYPGTGMQPTAVSPVTDVYPNMGYPGAGYTPTAVSPVTDVYPNMGYPGAGYTPAVVSPVTDVYPNIGYPGAGYTPTAISPVMDVYPNMGYPGAGYTPTAISPVTDVYPNMGYPETGMLPAAVSPAKDLYPDKHKAYKNLMDPLYIPPLPPLRKDDGGGSAPVTLHASEEKAAGPATAPKKRHPASKKKAPARRPKRKPKESLPWIKW